MITVVHIRKRHNGIPQDNGGYTLAIKRHSDGYYKVAIAVCQPERPYNKGLGREKAIWRLDNLPANVMSLQDVIERAQVLQDKVSTGEMLTTRVNVDRLLRMQEAA